MAADGNAELGVLRQVQTEAAVDGSQEMNGDDAQIDSSDEYDPSAHTFQDVSHAPPPPPSNPSSPPTNTTTTTTLTTIHHPPAPELESTSAPSTPTVPVPVQGGVNAAADAQNLKQDLLTTGGISAVAAEPPKMRLPHDRIGILEDRIAADEKGDTQAWLELIDELKRRGKIEEARKAYERFFVVFPTAADERVALVLMENEAGNKKMVESIFQTSLKASASLKLWSAYMNHVRRYHDMALDKSGKASQTIWRAYQVVLDNVGQDKDSGSLWQDYIAFLKTTPGVIGGTTWQDSQKIDRVRAVYQQAIVVPHQATEIIWTDYTNFETGINKQTGRKFIQDKSPDYMQARTAYRELQNITRGLVRTTLPRLPPAAGCDGFEEYEQQRGVWGRWIAWEKSDPLVIKSEDISKWKNRVVYVYKQALMALRFWPEMWLDAAEFCFDNDLESEGDTFLVKGIEANPESPLLAIRQADRLEMSTTNGNDDDSKAARGLTVRAPYDTCLTSLYSLLGKARESEASQIGAAGAALATTNANAASRNEDNMDEDTERGGAPQNERNGDHVQRQQQVESIRRVHQREIDTLKKTIASVWVILMRAFQRMQGTGSPQAKIGGSRGIFAEARKRGDMTGELFCGAAMLEYHNGSKEAAGKIFERGSKLFPKDSNIALNYIKLLLNNNDTTNARVVFETAVSRLLAEQDGEIKALAKPLFQYFHGFESRYGELAQVMKLEARIRTAFPDDATLPSFASRFSDGPDDFNPVNVRPIVSWASQHRARTQQAAPAVNISSIEVSPRPLTVQPIQAVVSSPKRPLPADLSDATAYDRAPKIARADSPLKGAAGRRQVMNNSGINNSGGIGIGIGGIGAGAGASGPASHFGGAPSTSISFLLSIIPPASAWQQTRLSADAMVRLVQNLQIPANLDELNALRAARQQGQLGGGGGGGGGGIGGIGGVGGVGVGGIGGGIPGGQPQGQPYWGAWQG